MSEVVRPIVRVAGEIFENYPEDFYIPIDYLEIMLDRFEGPLDLLLFIIRKRNFDIFDLPIAKVTEQYMEYLNRYRKTAHQELAIEYLVMASTLIALKSRLLLPSRVSDDTEEEECDPRAELAMKLQAYARCQELAQILDQQPRIWRDYAPIALTWSQAQQIIQKPQISDIYRAYEQMKTGQQLKAPHEIFSEQYSIEEAINYFSKHLPKEGASFQEMVLREKRSLQWYLSCFLGVLELGKQRTFNLYQEQPFESLYISWSYQDEYSSERFD